MFKEAISSVKKGIFPIFFEKVEWNMTQIWVSGTWFFISNEGYFLTAYHVVKDIPQGSNILYVWNLPDNPIQTPIKIKEVFSDARYDIFLWKVDIKVDKYLTLLDSKAEVWESICISWYPLAKLWQNQDWSINVNNVRQYWMPTFLLDNSSFIGVNWKDYPESFLMRDMSIPWMSWWPIFDIKWGVVWMDVMNTTRNIPLPEKSIHIDNWVWINSNFMLDKIKDYI